MFQKILISLGFTTIIVVGVLYLRAQSAGPAAEMILFNGKIVTVDENFTYGQALAIANGKILAVGSNEEIRKLAVPETHQIDLAGKTVIPGLADNHLHTAGGGPGVDLSRVRTMEELLEAITARVKQSKPGALILTNGDWHEAQLKEQRLPLRRDLDTVSPNHPVVVVRGAHEFILNSAALKKWNVTKETPVPEGGSISRYADGELNGELVDAAKRLVTLPRPPQKDLEARIREKQEEYQKLHAVGLTSVRHPGGSIEQYRFLEEMKRRGLLTMRVNFLLRMQRSRDRVDVEKVVASWNVPPDEGNEWLRIGGIKLGVDGGFEGGWMREPYAEPYDRGGTYYGLQTVPQETYTAVVKDLTRLGWRVATHAVGDAAIDQVLAGYEEANEVNSIVGRRWTIEHAFITRPDQFPRINRLGVVISAQNHLYVAGPSLKKYWGEERAAWMSPMRAYLDNNIKVSSGTDAAVVPYPPLWTIYHFITRDTISGGVYGKDQRISRQEALQVATINNAYLTFEEDIKGSLEPGKFADLVVLSGDIMTCPEAEIDDLTVLMTMVNGHIVFRHRDFHS